MNIAGKEEAAALCIRAARENTFSLSLTRASELDFELLPFHASAYARRLISFSMCWPFFRPFGRFRFPLEFIRLLPYSSINEKLPAQSKIHKNKIRSAQSQQTHLFSSPRKAGTKNRHVFAQSDRSSFYLSFSQSIAILSTSFFAPRLAAAAAACSPSPPCVYDATAEHFTGARKISHRGIVVRALYTCCI